MAQQNIFLKIVLYFDKQIALDLAEHLWIHNLKMDPMQVQDLNRSRTDGGPGFVGIKFCQVCWRKLQYSPGLLNCVSFFEKIH